MRFGTSCQSNDFQTPRRKAQSAVEYLLLVAAVIVVVLFAFRTYIPAARIKSEAVYNITANHIMGDPAVMRSGPGDVYP